MFDSSFERMTIFKNNFVKIDIPQEDIHSDIDNKRKYYQKRNLELKKQNKRFNEYIYVKKG